MIGNLVTGMALLGPTAMLGELATSLSVSIREAGLLITYGSMVLCFAAPLAAWVTSGMDRRVLLAGTIGILAICSFASALAPDYYSLLFVRVITALASAHYAPQAASVMATLAPPEKRGSSISYVFLGWTITAAIGLPIIAVVATYLGWRVIYAGIGVASTASALLLAWRLPRGLRGAPVNFNTWVGLFHNRFVVVLLLVTMTTLAGQFVLITFIGPTIARSAMVGPEAVSLVFAAYGACAFTGMLNATRVVDRWGAYNTSAMCTAIVMVGMALWTLGLGVYAAMLLGAAVWGFGFGGITSMQQVRLVAAAPALSAASVSLNTSLLYVGQAIGSAIGGALYSAEMFVAAGVAAVAFVALALSLVVSSRNWGAA